MLQVEGAREYSEADALAIETLFRRIAERGHRIRLQRQAIDPDLTAKGINGNAGPVRDPLSVVHNAHTSSMEPTLGG